MIETLLPFLSMLALQVGASTAPIHDPAADLVVPDGLAVTLAAESPLFFNPTAMDVDEHGRLWITEAVNYRKWDGRNPGRDHAEGDRVVVLEDDDGDGVYDRSTVFAQEERLVSPLGIAVFGSTVVVSNSPDLIVYHDDDGDLRADRSEVLLTGFGGHDHDHGLHSVVAGPDGRWWFAAGNAGPHIVTDKSGFTLRSGSLYTGGGQFTADNKPGLVSDDGRVWAGGLICSVNPDGTDLRVHAHNFRNQYEVALDAFGEMYTEDNDDDGNRGCRTVWVMEGGNYGYFSADGSRYWTADRRPGQDTATAHWHQDDPGVAPSGTINGAGGPTGVAVYEGALMAPWIEGAVLNADAGAGKVYAHRPRAEGAGIVLDPGLLISARADEGGNGARWFRPSDVCVAPDGSVLVADWYDPGVGGHLARDAEAYGRILRIAPVGHRVTVPEIDLSTTEGALAALLSPAVNVRQLGRDALRARDEDGERAMALLLASGEDRERALALVLLADRDESALSALIHDDPSEAVRVAAIRAAWRTAGDRPRLDLSPAEGRDPENVTSSTVGLLYGIERSPAVAREAALHSWPRRRPLNEQPRRAADALRLLAWLDHALAYPVGDRAGLEAVGLAALGWEDQYFAVLPMHLEPIENGLLWSDRMAELAWRLHPPAAIPGLTQRANATELSLAERRRMIDALGFCPGQDAAVAVQALAVTGPADTRELARFWVERHEAGLWASHGVGLPVLEGDPAAAELAWSSGLVRSGAQSVDVDVTGAELLWVLVGDADNGNACDWAAVLEPRFITADGDVAATTLPFVSAEAGWGSVQIGKDCEGGTLSVGGEVSSDGIGTHAPSALAWAVPPGATRFTARLAPEDTGLNQGPNAPTSLTFEVRVSRAPDWSLLRALEATVRDPRADADVREDAALALAEDLHGAMTVVDLARQGLLNDELLASVGTVIFAHPDGAVRALAHGLFPRQGAAQELPSLDELLALDGDPSRGRRLFTSTRAQCSVCHSVSGRGGNVGPDLTEVVTKLERPALLDAVLNPSAGIAHGYDGWLLSLADGRRLTGFIQADGERLLFKDSTGERHVLAPEQVFERRPLQLSIMPEGVALGLSPAELADVLAFLAEDRRAPDTPGSRSRLGQPITLFDGSTLDAWVAFLPGKQDSAGTWSIVGEELVCEGQPIGYLHTKDSFQDFVLELEWRFLPGREPGNSGVLLRLNGEHKVWPRSLEAQLHHRNAGDIWNIDALDLVPDPARTSGRRTVKLLPSNERPHGEWNRYRIVLDRDRLTLEVNGQVQNQATWAEELAGPIALQSEGAPIAFRRIVLTPILH